MSRIGKRPIIIPAGVELKVEGTTVSAKGPKGELKLALMPEVTLQIADGKALMVAVDRENRFHQSLWGTFHALLNNIVTGVSKGFEKKLEVIGVGYRAAADKTKLTMQLGFSHPVIMDIPAGLEVKVEKNTITITGIDKQLVGQFAAVVRSHRPPEPYKGKGIKYSDEVVRRKAGKVVKAVGG